MKFASGLCLIAMSAMSSSATASAYPPAASPKPASGWRAMTLDDLDAAAAVLRGQYISAAYPNPKTFAVELDRLLGEARRDAASVNDYGGYAATLKRFISGLHDRHVNVGFTIAPTEMRWPGFTARYVGGRYVIAASRLSELPDGKVVSSCDGRPFGDWVARTAPYVGYSLDLESTRAFAAPLTLVDQGNPFVRPPARCVIDGEERPLQWTALSYPDYFASVQSLGRREDRTVAVSPFGDNGAWVRLGEFQPKTDAELAAWRKVITEAPTWRDKSVVVLDVRGNRGGPYDWMMGLLRSFYGPRYADRYAQARLAIRPVFRATPEILAYNRESDAEERRQGVVVDASTDVNATEGVAEAVRLGRPVFVAPHSAVAPSGGPAPVNPVRAKVFVLTDYACGSVCIAFVDEMKRFPGVEQIGTDTSVDSRTGTPLRFPLPSGNGGISVATMTRDGRPRGDNVPQRPSRLFTGDIADTIAVRAWVATLVGERQSAAPTPRSNEQVEGRGRGVPER